MAAGGRLAFVTPLPGSPSGIADYSLDVVEALGDRYAVDFYTGQDTIERDRLPSGCGVFLAPLLPERHAREPYRLIVYQLGNSLEHACVYDLLARLPGLLVLHDLVLHHSRARMFLESAAARAYAADPSSATLRDAALTALQGYRDELAHSYPDVAERLAETHLNTVGTLLPYAYPLFRLPVEAARRVVVHNEFMARTLRADVPQVPVVRVPMPMRRRIVDPKDVLDLRSRLGLTPEHLVVGCFGRLTPEKRVVSVARAVARASATLPSLRLLLVGDVPDQETLRAQLERVGVAARTIVAGRVPFDELGNYMEAADIAAHLRYPTARETSAALLRLLAQGRPTIISDLEHQAEIPAEAVLRIDVSDEEGEVTRALLRLGERPELRARLGRAAAEYVRREHSFERTGAAWSEVIESTATTS